MSGVIDRDGQQWEHCNGCGELRRFPEGLVTVFQKGKPLGEACAIHGVPDLNCQRLVWTQWGDKS
jgi:hypothetical protein